MPRAGSATTLAAFADARVVFYALVELDYAGDPVRVTSLPYAVTYEGNTYVGVGGLGSIGEIAEGSEIRSYGVSLRMSGIPLAYAKQVIAQDGQGRAGRIWLGVLDPDSHAASGQPVLVYQGRIDVTDIELGSAIAVTVTLESRLIDWERARHYLYTDADQQAAFPGDTFLEFVAGVADMEITWGRA